MKYIVFIDYGYDGLIEAPDMPDLGYDTLEEARAALGADSGYIIEGLFVE